MFLKKVIGAKLKRSLGHGKRLVSGEDTQTLIAVLNIVLDISLSEKPPSEQSTSLQK